MWEILFCLGFTILVLFWLIGKGASTSETNHSNVQYISSSNSNNNEGISMDPTDIDNPANMAMWMELGEL